MKQLCLILLAFAGVLTAQAQVMISEPRPDWVRQIPVIPKGANFIYVYGMGEGKTEQEAELNAWKNALYNALQENGQIGIIGEKTTLDEIFSMEDLRIRIPDVVLPRRLLCRTDPILTTTGRIKIYVLLQINRDGSKPVDFYEYNIHCESDEYLRALREWNNYIRKQRKKDNGKKNKIVLQEQSSFFSKKHNSYFAWGTIDSGYPAFLGTGFLGRHGGIVGIGYQLVFGVNLEKSGQNPFHYTMGVRFFPYKNLYLSGNYGTLAAQEINEDREQKIRLGTGYSILAGYDLIMGKLDDISGILSFGAGIAYNATMSQWQPVLNVKIGFVWPI